MNYMRCTRCGLTVRLRAPYLTVKQCPRCIARARVALPMEPAEGPCVWSDHDFEGVDDDAISRNPLPASAVNQTTSTSP